jgi:16S rRNA (cytosine967-C5)-methyltransferase
MSRFFSWLNTSQELVSRYGGEEPFASYIKKHFAQHKKYGSKDRKIISQLCYGYFRLGNAFDNQPVEDRILLGLFLCTNTSSDLLQEFRPSWNENISLTVSQKFAYLNANDEFQKVFPLHDELSNAINREAYQYSMLEQPLLFLRVRPGKLRIVEQKLKQVNIQFDKIGDSCLAMVNSSNVDGIIKLNQEAVIQDLNSQRVLDILPEDFPGFNDLHVWDCCAASGGKSILLKDKVPAAQLTVSDIRVSILKNLQQRFRLAGIHSYQSFVADLSSPTFSCDQLFDLIICDAPCSGSGTWGRTPEQISFFNLEKINHYTHLQKNISLNASKSLKKGGFFLYITCSVFEKENEGIVNHLLEKSSLRLVSYQYYTGFDKKADTLFAALFTL